MSLKTDLHSHAAGDPQDKFIKYTPRQLVERAIALGFDVLAITPHTQVFYDPDLDQFASDSGLVLMPGMESNVNGKHVLLYCQKDKEVIDELNAESREARGNLSFDKIASLKEEGIVKLVIATHPYFVLPYCLGDELVKRQDLFDLVEESCYHTGLNLPSSLSSLNLLNRNQKARIVATRLGIPMIATSDTHYLHNFGRNYSIVRAEPDLESVLKILQSKDQTRIKPVSPPLTNYEYLAFVSKLIKH